MACESPAQGYCTPDTPNLDLIVAALDHMDDTANDLSERVHRIESELQSEALWAAVEFIHEDGWALSVVASDGTLAHTWGQVNADCVRFCLDESAEPPFETQCRGVPVGATGHVLCGSREVY